MIVELIFFCSIIHTAVDDVRLVV